MHQSASRIERSLIFFRRGIDNARSGDQRLRVRDRHARRQSKPSRRVINAGKNAALALRRCLTSGLSRGSKLPLFRRSRSVGQRGRKSETTLRIACLHNPRMRLAALDAQQLDVPALPL